jgi:uncharacterized repeat protein (TIGR01451 family)
VTTKSSNLREGTPSRLSARCPALTVRPTPKDLPMLFSVCSLRPVVARLSLLAAVLFVASCSRSASKPPSGDAAYGQSKQAIWANGNFEADGIGTTPPTGWSITTFTNTGVTGTATAPPATFADLNLTTPGTLNNETSVVGGTTASQFDPDLGSGETFRYPLYGQRTALVNYLNPTLDGHNKNNNMLQQTLSIAPADIDPADGNIHVRFAIAPVLENPTHTYNQQPYYFVQLLNLTRSTTLYTAFNVAGTTGVPWHTATGVRTMNPTQWLDWQLVDIQPIGSSLAVGDQVQLSVIASGCSLGGHFGRIYIDGVGSVVPGPYVTATGPTTAFPNADVTYKLAYANGGTVDTIGTHIDMVIPSNTTFVSVTPPSGVTCTTPAVGGTGTLSCTIGTFTPGSHASIGVTVNVNAGSTGSIVNGNYDIAATNAPALLGPAVTTTLASGPPVLSFYSGSPQVATVSTAFAQPLRVLVRDSTSAPVAGAVVTFAVPGSSPTATLSSLTATTDASGIASVTATADGGRGNYTVSASMPQIAGTVNFQLTNTGLPVAISVFSGDNQSATVGTALGAPLTVLVADSGGNPVVAATVTFTPPATGATTTLASLTAVTDTAGHASVSATAGTLVGSYTVPATVSGVMTPANFTLTNTVGAPATITVSSGNNQSAIVGTPISGAIVALVKDTYGNVVPNAVVTFTPPTSGATATLASTTATTTSAGLASVAVTAGTLVGSYTVPATVSGVIAPANFTLTNTVGAAAAIAVFSGNNQSATVGTPIGAAIVARVTDTYGNVVPNAVVTFTPPTSGATATLASTTATTTSAGLASVGVTAGTMVGSYTVPATVPGVIAPANFTLTNTVGAAAAIAVFSGNNQTTTVGMPLAAPIVARVTDTYGNVVPGATVTFTAPSTGGATATLLSTTATTTSAGLASVTATAGSVTGSYTIPATVVGASTPAKFSLTNSAGVATTIALHSGNNQSALVGAMLGAALVAQVTDTYGNVVPGATVTFTAPSSGATATLSSPTAVTNAQGLASITAIAGSVTGPYGVTASAGTESSVTFALSNRADSVSGTLTAPTNNLASVGSLVAYRASVLIPQGFSSTLSLDVALPPELVFQQGANLTASNAVTCNGSTCDVSTPTVDTTGHNIKFSFVNVVNADTDPSVKEYLSWDVIAVVANIPSAVAGAPLTSSGLFKLEANTLAVTAQPITVVEPALTFSSSVPATLVDAGDTVTVTTRVQNPTVSNGTIGFDVLVNDVLPAKLLAQAGTYVAGTCPPAKAVVLGGTTAQFTFDTIGLGVDCSFTFQAKVTDAVLMGETLTAAGTGTWTSQPGNATTSLSMYSAIATERTGSIRDPGGDVNTYAGSFAFSATSSAVYSLAQTLVGTSGVDTTGNSLAAGEDAVIRLDVNLQEGTHPDVVVSPTLPAGMVASAVALDTSKFNGTVATMPSLSDSPGASLSFDLGQVIVAGDNVPTNNTFSVLVTAHPVYGAAMLGGPAVAVVSQATVDDNAATTPDLALVYAVPLPKLTLTTTSAMPTAGAPVSFTATLTNAGNGPLCDTGVGINVPAGLTIVSPGADGIDNEGNGHTDEPAEKAYQTSGTTLRFGVVGCLAAGGTKHLTFLTTSVARLSPAALTATATLESYRTLAGAGQLLSPSSDLVDNNGNGIIDEAGDGVASVVLNPVAPQLVFQKSFADLTTAATREPGDTIRYTITLANTGTGPTVGAVISDPLPLANARLIPDSVHTSVGTVMLSGGTVIAQIGTLAAGATATVTVDIVLNTPLAQGVAVSNQAALTTQDNYGPVLSDDPATRNPNDATVLVLDSTNDTDGDGVPNAKDTDPHNKYVCSDLDHDKCDDCAIAGLQQPNNDGLDSDMDGLCDKGDPAPFDNDADDDGVIDGQEVDWWKDTDGDGVINVFDPDSDNDGILDGTEMGVTKPASGTDVSKGFFVPDQDPTTTTSMVDPDTDHGGVRDGAEDPNHNGRVDPGEMDPNNAADDVNKPLDSDNDGLTDAEEIYAGTDPHDVDTDDDGIPDGQEANWNQDTDHDGLINALDPDSDNDGILDGTETGVTKPTKDTEVSKGFYIPDADPTTTTCMINADTDYGGVRDGAEDPNHNGRIDPGEMDPNKAADDVNKPLDSDNDGLTDAEEILAGTNPHDADSDDDGVLDGDEPNWNQDTDHDGLINALDPDSDSDCIFDGTELGVTKPSADTDVSKGFFVPDADPSTRTCNLLADTDRGGTLDGAEDKNHNGRVDQGELDPDNKADDVGDIGGACVPDPSTPGFQGGIGASGGGGGCASTANNGLAWVGLLIVGLGWRRRQGSR